MTPTSPLRLLLQILAAAQPRENCARFLEPVIVLRVIPESILQAAMDELNELESREERK
jgi:hypothetical protein